MWRKTSSHSDKMDDYYTANRNEFDWLTLQIEFIKVETDKIIFLAVIWNFYIFFSKNIYFGLIHILTKFKCRNQSSPITIFHLNKLWKVYSLLYVLLNLIVIDIPIFELSLISMKGIEPLTFRIGIWCSIPWATCFYLINIFNFCKIKSMQRFQKE